MSGFLGDLENTLDKLVPLEDDDSMMGTGAGGERVKVINTGVSQTDALRIFDENVARNGVDLAESMPFMESQDHTLTVASAGAGKTTNVNLKILRDLISGRMMTPQTVQTAYGVQTVIAPARILVMTFSNSGAKELKRSFKDWQNKLHITGLDHTNIKFKTIHAEVKSALEEMGVPVNLLKSTAPYLREAANDFGIRSVNARSNQITMEEIRDLEGIVMYARNRLDAKRYDHQLMDDYRLTPAILDAFLKSFEEKRRRTGQMDFEDMQEILLEGCQINPAVADFVANRYDYIFVDEAQDTSQLQYAVLKYYAAKAKRVTLVGDDDQTIYSWRGSDNEIILRKFIEDYNPVVCSLSTNYRVPSRILNAIIPSIESNTKRHYKPIRAARDGGELYVDYSRNVNHLVEGIRKDMKDGGTVAVIARTNADLLAPAIVLELANERHYGVSGSVGMTGKLERQIFGSISLITKRLPPNIEEILKLVAPRHAYVEVNRFLMALKTDRNLNIFNVPMEDIQRSAPSLLPFLRGVRDAKENVGEVEAYLFILAYLQYEVFTGQTAYSQRARDLISFCIDLVNTHPALEGFRIDQLEELFTVVLPEKLEQRSKYAAGDQVLCKLTTVHDAKGKQWDSVYIWNDVDGSFPGKAGSRDLTEDEYEEERRLHYIAWTRPKKKLTVLTTPGLESPFLKEADLREAVLLDSSKNVAIEAVGGKKERMFTAPGSSDNVPAAAETTAARETPPKQMDVHPVVMQYLSEMEQQGGLSSFKPVIMYYSSSVERIVAAIGRDGVLNGQESEQETKDKLTTWFDKKAKEIYDDDDDDC